MMSPDHNNSPVKRAGNNYTTKEDQNQSKRKAGGGSSSRPELDEQQQQAAVIKCPRCDSPNTKFCYYNNYSLSQPRHFCKTCRRYWTRGGALRNVPIGGGCRKNNKKMMMMIKSSFSTATSSPNSEIMSMGGGLSFPRPAAGVYNSQFDPLAGSSANSNLMGFSNYPILSSIESLSSINQDLHWKMQQQRLAMLYGTDEDQNHEKGIHSSNISIVSSSSVLPLQDHQNRLLAHEKPHPILFQNPELAAASSKPGPDEISGVNNPRKGNETAATEWFFGNSYTPTPTTSCSNGNGNNDHNTTSNWKHRVQVQAWNHDLHHHYTTLP